MSFFICFAWKTRGFTVFEVHPALQFFRAVVRLCKQADVTPAKRTWSAHCKVSLQHSVDVCNCIVWRSKAASSTRNQQCISSLPPERTDTKAPRASELARAVMKKQGAKTPKDLRAADAVASSSPAHNSPNKSLPRTPRSAGRKKGKKFAFVSTRIGIRRSSSRLRRRSSSRRRDSLSRRSSGLYNVQINVNGKCRLCQ